MGSRADLHTAGGGANTFFFDVLEPAVNKDRVSDFAHGTSKFAINATAFGAFGGDTLGALHPAAFGLGNRATPNSQHILYNRATGAWLCDADGRGDNFAVVITVLLNTPVMDSGDFVLI